jgi:hypothetical protein
MAPWGLKEGVVAFQNSQERSNNTSSAGTGNLELPRPTRPRDEPSK